MVDAIKSWLYTPDGLFYTMIGGLYLLGFIGLGIGLLARYFTKKEAREKEEAQLKRSQGRYLSQHKSNSVHHV